MNKAQDLFNVLQQLVELKERKDAFGKDELYEQMQPIAWANAKKAVADYKELKLYSEIELEPLFYSAHALLHFLFDPDGQTKPECVHWLTLFKEAVDSFPKPNSINIVIEDMIHRIAIAKDEKVAKVVNKSPSKMQVVFESGKFYYITVSTAPPNI